MSEDNFFNGKDKASKLREILDEIDQNGDRIEYDKNPIYKLGFDDGFDEGYMVGEQRARDEYKKVLDSIQTLIKNIN